MTVTCSALVVDDDPFTRTVLSSTIRELGATIVAAVATANEAMEIAAQQLCDLAIIDLDLGEGPSGIDLAHGLRRINPKVAIVILSTYTEPRLLGRKQQELPNGSRFIVKQSIVDSSVLENVMIGALAHPIESTAGIVHSEIVSNLSDLQIEIIRHISEGKSNGEIARLVIMEEASVEKAIARIIKKIGVKADRTQNQRVMLAQFYFQLTKAMRDARE